MVTPPRRALTDQLFDAIYDLVKVTEQIARLGETDSAVRELEDFAKWTDDMRSERK